MWGWLVVAVGLPFGLIRFRQCSRRDRSLGSVKAQMPPKAVLIPERVEQNAEQNAEQKAEQNAEQKAEQKVKQKVEQKVKQKADQAARPQRPSQMDLLEDSLIFLQLLPHLLPRSLALLSTTCTRFDRMADEDSLWRTKWLQTYGEIPWHEECERPRDQFSRDYSLRTNGPAAVEACSLNLHGGPCYCIIPIKGPLQTDGLQRLLIGCAVPSTDVTQQATDPCRQDGTARLMQLSVDGGQVQKTGELRGHAGQVLSCALANSDRFVLTGSDDHEIRMWELWSQNSTRLDPHCYMVIRTAHYVTAMSAMPSTDRQAVSLITGHYDNVLRVWSVQLPPSEQDSQLPDVERSRQLLRIDSHSDWIRCVSVGQVIASGSTDGELHVHALDGSPIAQLPAHNGATQCLVQRADLVISGSEEGSVVTHRLAACNTDNQQQGQGSGIQLVPIERRNAHVGVRSICLSGGTLVVGCRDGTMRGWDLNIADQEPAWSRQPANGVAAMHGGRTVYGLVLLRKVVATVDGMGVLRTWRTE